MIYRCYDQRANRYENYGGRGIRVCERWLESFDNFFADMGERPSKEYSIERLDSNGDYEPLNCKWATRKEQQLTRRDVSVVEYNGVVDTLTGHAKRLGLVPETVRWRIKHGRSLDEALSTPIHKLTRKF